MTHGSPFAREETMRTIVSAIVAVCLAVPLHAQETRPAKDQIGYCWNGTQLERFMDFLQARAPKPPDDLPRLIAGISPHDDYLYAGRVYWPLFQKISAPEVVIFGVTHRAIREKLGDPQGKLIFDSHADWQGPYGKIRVSRLRERLMKGLGPQYCMVSNDAHRLEHSIEGMLPFLQYGRRDVRITPIMVTAMPFDTMDAVSQRLAEVLAAYMKEKNLEPGKDIFFLISADANHYGKDFNNTAFGEGLQAHEKGTAYDRKLVDTYLQGTVSTRKLKDLAGQLWGKDFKGNGDTVWCGKYSIPFGLLTVSHLTERLSPNRRLTGRLLLYSDTYSEGVLPIEGTGMGVTNPSSLEHWVGFFSAGFYLQ
jgi:AmmeMemoRadiSam system protein B